MFYRIRVYNWSIRRKIMGRLTNPENGIPVVFHIYSTQETVKFSFRDNVAFWDAMWGVFLGTSEPVS